MRPGCEPRSEVTGRPPGQSSARPAATGSPLNLTLRGKITRPLILWGWYEETGSSFDPFDLICHVAYEQEPLTRKERAEQVKKRDYFTKYGDLARKVIAALLDKYADDGGLDFENPEIIQLDPLNKLGSPVEIIRAFGGKPAYDAAIHALTGELYKVA